MFISAIRILMVLTIVSNMKLVLCIYTCIYIHVSYMFHLKHLPHEVLILGESATVVFALSVRSRGVSTRDICRRFYKITLLVSLKASCT